MYISPTELAIDEIREMATRLKELGLASQARTLERAIAKIAKPDSSNA